MIADPAILTSLTALPGRERITAKGWHNTNCPNVERHPNGDKSPSFGWRQTPDGNVIVHCHAGCTTEEIVAALGLQMRDLFVPQNGSGREYLNERVYVYRDAAGKQHFKTRLDFKNADGTAGKDTQWEAGAKASDVLWYRNEVLQDPAKTNGFVYITEGEKDADALCDILRGTDRVVIAAPSASYDPPQEAIDALTGRAVMLWPDLDSPGHALMQRIAARLIEGEIASVFWIDPPDRATLPDGAGAADWVETVHTAGQDPRSVLDAMTKVDDPGPRPAPVRDLIGRRTANDLPVGPPPALIVSGFLLPDRTTLMYGLGGTGKGVITAIFAAILVREYGLVVAIIDYEDHPEEWGSRLDGITFANGSRLTAEEKSRIHYRSPYDVGDWTADTGSLHVVAMALRAQFDALGVNFLVVDSYSAATDGEEGMGGQRDAKTFAQAVTKIGRPALVLAHVADSGERLPDKPFGSVHVRNLVARLMYALAQDKADADDSADDDGILIAPTTIRVEAKRTKGNRYGRRANRFIEITFHPGGAITWDLDAAAPSLPLWQQVEQVLLEQAPTAMTAEKIVAAVNEDFPRDKPVKVNAIRDALSKHPDDFIIVDGASRPKTWSVRGSRVQRRAPLEGGALLHSTSQNPAQSLHSVSAESSAESVSVNAESSAEPGSAEVAAVSAEPSERGAQS